jgi:hypothetical protein
MAGDNNLSLGSTGLTTASYNYVSPPSQLSTLPLRLLSFSAYQKNNYVELQWKTAAEENTALFEVERSSDGQAYTRIGTVAAAGNSSTTQSYQFTDQQVSNPVSYYRLKMVDRDAAFRYSKTIAVRTAANNQKLKFFPNPVNQTLFIKLPAGNNTVSILDASGKLLKAFNIIQQGDGFSSIDVSRLASGSYYIKAGNRLELFFKQ